MLRIFLFHSLRNVFANQLFWKHICAPASVTTLLFPASHIMCAMECDSINFVLQFFSIFELINRSHFGAAFLNAFAMRNLMYPLIDEIISWNSKEIQHFKTVKC